MHWTAAGDRGSAQRRRRRGASVGKSYACHIAASARVHNLMITFAYQYLARFVLRCVQFLIGTL